MKATSKIFSWMTTLLNKQKGTSQRCFWFCPLDICNGLDSYVNHKKHRTYAEPTHSHIPSCWLVMTKANLFPSQERNQGHFSYSFYFQYLLRALFFSWNWQRKCMHHNLVLRFCSCYHLQLKPLRIPTRHDTPRSDYHSLSFLQLPGQQML